MPTTKLSTDVRRILLQRILDLLGLRREAIVLFLVCPRCRLGRNCCWICCPCRAYGRRNRSSCVRRGWWWWRWGLTPFVGEGLLCLGRCLLGGLRGDPILQSERLSPAPLRCWGWLILQSPCQPTRRSRWKADARGKQRPRSPLQEELPTLQPRPVRQYHDGIRCPILLEGDLGRVDPLAHDILQRQGHTELQAVQLLQRRCSILRHIERAIDGILHGEADLLQQATLLGVLFTDQLHKSRLRREARLHNEGPAKLRDQLDDLQDALLVDVPRLTLLAHLQMHIGAEPVVQLCQDLLQDRELLLLQRLLSNEEDADG
mmetsp:Transcript_94036/g.236999  ORF Transcript_94036/g.236999 Transcript_94036/m.236999 type:complete len:317 (-) Transcript_94036:312-1262(-)